MVLLAIAFLITHVSCESRYGQGTLDDIPNIPIPNSYNMRSKVPSISMPEMTANIDKNQERFYPSKATTDYMYERLKSAMHYKPSYEELKAMSDNSHNYRQDDDDVRSSHSWPYYRFPYNYDNKVDFVGSKDKRYAFHMDVIPVHEYTEDITTPPTPLLSQITNDYHRHLQAEQPFLSAVVNDYNYANDGDSLEFKDWTGLEESDEGTRYPQTNYISTGDYDSGYMPIEYADHTNYRDTGKSNSYKNINQIRNYEEGDNNSANEKADYDEASRYYKGKNQFQNDISHQYADELNDRDVTHFIKKLNDKGERKKGFHSVYHKDEFKMDKEFYDNTGNQELLHDRGKSKIKNGAHLGTTFLRATAEADEDARSANRKGSKSSDNFRRKYEGHDASEGIFDDHEKYKDLRKSDVTGHLSAYL